MTPKTIILIVVAMMLAALGLLSAFASKSEQPGAKLSTPSVTLSPPPNYIVDLFDEPKKVSRKDSAAERISTR